MTDGYKIGYWRFSAWFMGLSIALPIASYALARFTGIELGQFAGSIIPMMIAAMQEGIQFTRGTKRVPTRKERLLIARMLTCIAIAWSSVLIFVVILLARPVGMSLGAIGGPGLFIGVALVVIALFFFLAWLFVGIGAKNEMKFTQTPSKQDFE